MEKINIYPDVDLQHSREIYGKMNSRDFYAGTSFKMEGEWTENRHYFSDKSTISYVSCDNTLLVCRKSHISCIKPNIIKTESGDIVGIDEIGKMSNELWSIVLKGIVGPQGPIGEIPELKEGDGIKIIDKSTVSIKLNPQKYNNLSVSNKGLYLNTAGEKRDGGEVFNDYAGNEVIGGFAHAEGMHTSALKSLTHTEGVNTTAFANIAHAEGVSTHKVSNEIMNTSDKLIINAWKNESSPTTLKKISELRNIIPANEIPKDFTTDSPKSFSLVKGFAAHGEGSNGLVLGSYSHVEGEKNLTYGIAAHAEGKETEATANYAHAEGNGTMATIEASHAEGRFNKSNNGLEDSLKTIHSVGIGSDKYTRKNAHEITLTGDHYIIGIGNYNGLNLVLKNNTKNKDVKSLQEILKEFENGNQNIQNQINNLSSRLDEYDKYELGNGLTYILTEHNKKQININIDNESLLIDKNNKVYVNLINGGKF